VAKKATEQGCYFSINHRMLVADSAIKVVRYLPSDRILTETDAPFIEIAGRKAEPRDVATTMENSPSFEPCLSRRCRRHCTRTLRACSHSRVSVATD